MYTYKIHKRRHCYGKNKVKNKKMISSILIIFLIMMNVNVFVGAFTKKENSDNIKELEKNNIIYVADKSTVDDYKKDMQGRTI